jgi:hypothetical protein
MAYRRAALFAFLQLLLANHVAALECTHPKIMTEAILMNVQVGSGEDPGDMLVWDGNDLCDGPSVTNLTVGCTLVGKAYGHCTFLNAKNLRPLPNLDCVYSFVFPDGSTLVVRGIDFAGVDDRVVVGGTGCYHGAQGYATVTHNEEENSYTYNLTMVEVDLGGG